MDGPLATGDRPASMRLKDAGMSTIRAASTAPFTTSDHSPPWEFIRRPADQRRAARSISDTGISGSLSRL